ncbi:MAG: RNB domain-containing ribonuclease [Thermoanaerobaculia bacterium]
MDCRRLLIDHGFEPGFSAQALAEAAALPDEIPSDVEDLRHLPWLSIDREGTRAVDQVTTAERRGPVILVRIAIADVDALVPPGSALDRRARQNARSLYTPAGTFPLLPERIAAGLGSFREGRDRLAVVVELPAGEIRRARVRNQARLGFREVTAWLEGEPLAKRPMKMSVLKKQLRLHAEAAGRLGRCASAEELLESLLSAANAAVAAFLSLPAARATAPSRRYADLVTQRLLKAALAGRPAPYSEEELQELAAWCTRREEEASQVEAQLA